LNWDLLLLGLLWGLWCTLHSLLASRAASTWVRRHLGAASAWYRLFYNILALLTLLPLLIWYLMLPYDPLLRWEGLWKGLRVFLVLLAVWVLAAGAMVYPLGEFLGISQIRRQGNGREGPTGEQKRLVRLGILGLVRHPWYLAVLILLWSRDLAARDLVTSGILTLYLLVGARLEEGRLQAEFGEEFRKYRQEVSMIFPWKWVKVHGGRLLRELRRG
jgi:protein-S-isoprenylcysteine O-methyltransferase Ste14